MNTDLKHAQALAAQGMNALKAGDAPAAIARFEAALAAGWPGAPIWVALSQARAMTGDREGAHAALDQAVTIDPQDVRALIFLGDHCAADEETARAARLYRQALTAAAARPSTPEIERHLARIRPLAEDSTAPDLHALFAGDGLEPDGADRDFAQSLDILAGTRLAYHSRPTRYFLPGLRQRQFYDTGEFAWAEALEAKTPLIRAELERLLTADPTFTPYVEAGGREGDLQRHPLQGNPDWSAFYLVKQGEVQKANAAQCPETFAAIEALGEEARPAPAPSVLFSLLKPGAAIPPHYGMLNTRLICHLPLIIPEGCGFRVGNDTRAWEPGTLFAFDDTVEHEAWNRSDAPRYVLIFEIWRPDLTLRQRALVTKLFAAGKAPAPD